MHTQRMTLGALMVVSAAMLWAVLMPTRSVQPGVPPVAQIAVPRRATAQIAAAARPLDLARPAIARMHRIDPARQAKIARVSRNLSIRSASIMARAVARWKANGGYASGPPPDFQRPGTLCARELTAVRASAELRIAELLTDEERYRLVTSLPQRKRMAMPMAAPLAEPTPAPVTARAGLPDGPQSGDAQRPLG